MLGYISNLTQMSYLLTKEGFMYLHHAVHQTPNNQMFIDPENVSEVKVF